MAKLLFCPIGTDGFVFPAVGLALQLRDAGHEVEFATAARYESLFDQLSIRLHEGKRDSNGFDSFDVAIWARRHAIVLQTATLHRLLRTSAYDAVVTTQLCLGALVAARVNDVPIAVIGTSNYLWNLPEADDCTPSSRWHESEGRSFLNAANEWLGIPKVGEADPNPLLGDRYLLRTVEALDGRRHDDRVAFVGSMLWEPFDGVSEAYARWRGERGTPMIYASIGRSFDGPSVWPHVVRAVQELDLDCVSSLPRNEVHAESSHERIYRQDESSIVALARDSRCVVATGHPTAVLAALETQTPLVLAPNGSGSPETASALRAAGLATVVDGRNPTERCVVDAIRAAFHERPSEGALRRDVAASFHAHRRSRSAFVVLRDLLRTVATPRLDVASGSR